ncbi:MAG TPA: UbiA family prenyltransferase [Lacisediminihabitans sp.]|uniref:UbiA family prenyltransferase n=1 Tax=Lacisediminihabitans sp. TaxID=2787631 RepID=UPI002ED8C363
MPNKVVPLALSTHPGPAIAVTLVAVVLGIGLGVDPPHLVLLGLAFALNQASVGLSNDWIDAERDRAVGRTDKPVALGRIDAATVRTAAIVTAILAVLLTLPLGPLATIAHAVFIASAWSYNLWLKNTPLSALPYLVSFGLLPVVVAFARPIPALAAPWAIGLGALLGLAAHFANVLPDLEDDRRTGVSGLPHRLGRRASGAVICAALVAAALLAFFGPTGARTALQWAGLILTVLLAAAIAVVLGRPPTRLLFQLIIAAAIVDVVVLVFSGTRLLA